MTWREELAKVDEAIGLTRRRLLVTQGEQARLLLSQELEKLMATKRELQGV